VRWLLLLYYNFILFQVEAEQNGEETPLVWWMNGGPGASSLFGLFQENGPLLYTGGDGDDAFMSNPYSWSQHANLLYVEFGPGKRGL